MTAEKCPECGTWWRGFEHRCPPQVTTNHATIVAQPPYCPTCWHEQHLGKNCSNPYCTTCDQVNP